MDGKTCKDIDECENGTHDCGIHPCNNNYGGFACMKALDIYLIF